MSKRTFSDAERNAIVSQYLSGTGESATSSRSSDALSRSMSELRDAVAQARVADGEGQALTTEYGVTVTSGAALDGAKDIFQRALTEALSKQGLDTSAENVGALREMGDKLIDASFDSGLRSLTKEQANDVLDGLHQGVATAALSLAVNDLEGIPKSAGPAALASSDPDLTLQVLQVTAERMGETQLSGIQAVEGLQPAVAALEGVHAPTKEQVEVLSAVAGLEDRAVAALTGPGAGPESMAGFVQEVRALAANTREAFGEQSSSLAASLGALANAVENRDVDMAKAAFADSVQGGQDLATRTLTAFVESSGPALEQAQGHLDAFAPTATEGMGKLAALVNETGRDSEDLGGMMAVSSANLAVVMEAARERGDDFLADLDSLSAYRDVALGALAQRTMAAQAREHGEAEPESGGVITFEDKPSRLQGAEQDVRGPQGEGLDASSSKGEAQAEMEMAL